MSDQDHWTRYGTPMWSSACSAPFSTLPSSSPPAMAPFDDSGSGSRGQTFMATRRQRQRQSPPRSYSPYTYPTPVHSRHSPMSSPAINAVPDAEPVIVKEEEAISYSQFIIQSNGSGVDSPTTTASSSQEFDSDLLEQSLLSQSLAPPTEVPLRATQACTAMRKMMGIFRLNPFTVHSSRSDKERSKDVDAGQMTWCGEEAKPLDSEPQVIEWQLAGYEPNVEALSPGPEPLDFSALRSFSPEVEEDLGAALSRRPVPRKAWNVITSDDSDDDEQDQNGHITPSRRSTFPSPSIPSPQPHTRASSVTAPGRAPKASSTPAKPSNPYPQLPRLVERKSKPFETGPIPLTLSGRTSYGNGCDLQTSAAPMGPLELGYQYHLNPPLPSSHASPYNPTSSSYGWGGIPTSVAMHVQATMRQDIMQHHRHRHTLPSTLHSNPNSHSHQLYSASMIPNPSGNVEFDRSSPSGTLPVFGQAFSAPLYELCVPQPAHPNQHHHQLASQRPRNANVSGNGQSQGYGRDRRQDNQVLGRNYSMFDPMCQPRIPQQMDLTLTATIPTPASLLALQAGPFSS